jgi:hypothetical protein
MCSPDYLYGVLLFKSLERQEAEVGPSQDVSESCAREKASGPPDRRSSEPNRWQRYRARVAGLLQSMTQRRKNWRAA